ncbi:MAG: VWA domain-containing protein [Candidatus Omnitrophica bacterium]|nr:VWA domain-containing protein [Candidatus Omnitrophota bacterium]
MIFRSPLFLILLFFLPGFWLFARRSNNTASLRFSSIALAKNKPTLKVRLLENLIIFRLIAIGLIIIALARPQLPIAHQRVFKKGIDIVLALDTSTSMHALDFQIKGKRYNRLYVVKQVVEDFISQRENDRIGMIAFAANSYVVCPLTLDHTWLLTNLERVRIGMIEDGTAIGSSIMAALSRLKTSDAKTKIMILLTDGRNNAGKISPQTAAEAARALGVKIYTIGAGSIGEVPYPARDMFGRDTLQYMQIDIDESALAQIAQITGGKYFRATDTSSLKEIYKQINQLETTPFKQPMYTQYDELFAVFLLWAIVVFGLEQILANTLLIKIP